VSHPAQSLDEVVHQRNRLAILATLRGARQVEFTFLQKELDLTGGNLSRHLQVLEDAGLVQVEKGYSGKRPRTWARITKAGTRALATELDLLKKVVASIESAEDTTLTRAERRGHAGARSVLGTTRDASDLHSEHLVS
jgi:DNA-binding MarR family transcriptional regulator